MKKILLILCLFPILVFSQKSYKIPADSTILNNIGSGKNELVIRNATSNITGGVLTNLGNGVTAFVVGAGSGVSQTTLNDSILAVRNIRKVDTLYKNFASDSIIFFINGIRYSVLDKDNNTSLFPNGQEIVTESRDFQASDEGKLLVLLGDNISLTMPSGVTFTQGKTLGIYSVGVNNKFQSIQGGAFIEPYAGGVEDNNGEIVYLTVSSDGVNDILSSVSSAFVAEKTLNKYLYDQSQNAIPLSSTSTTTFTNKRITARVDSTTSSATPTINTDNIDTYKLTAQALDITSFTTNLTGTPTDDQILHIVIIGTGARAITWGSSFEASTVALPTTTVSTDRLDVYFIFNTATSKWRCGGVW